ncbi:hypothetical protein VP01_3253g1 [Puccinia sorghi]|uniref:Uncharacterized protein n=1 Tax=Puccinia sorghi TaxID=27349 RepID=A0A0L6UY31_9BASI|nr:hypothetical protein VP01_3253g1 [Puccinia sorghi]
MFQSILFHYLSPPMQYSHDLTFQQTQFQAFGTLPDCVSYLDARRGASKGLLFFIWTLIDTLLGKDMYHIILPVDLSCLHPVFHTSLLLFTDTNSFPNRIGSRAPHGPSSLDPEFWGEDDIKALHFLYSMATPNTETLDFKFYFSKTKT